MRIEFQPELLQQIKSLIHLPDLVQKYTRLNRYLKGLCPFHKERNPSLSVDAKKGLWHCFGCGKGGDCIAFIMEAEHLTFPNAVKLLAFEKNLSSQANDITIYILDAEDVATELKKLIGAEIGKAILKNVESGSELPSTAPSVLYIGNASKVKEAIQYTQTNKILSITGKPDLASKGVSLSIGIGKDGKPKILLNLTSSEDEKLNWNPAIIKISEILK